MFKVAGPMWAQATAVGDNLFARLVKTGKKVLRRVLQKEIESTTVREIPKPTWSLHSQAVKVDESASRRLIGGLFPKQVWKTQAAEARKQAALRLIRDAKKVPVFAFVGLGLGASLDKKSETDDVLCSGIRDLFRQYGGKEKRVEANGQYFSLQSLHLGQLIGQGCNAAVFEARPAGADPAKEEDEREEAKETSVDRLSESVESPTEPSSDESSDISHLQESVEAPAESSSDESSLRDCNQPSLTESTDDEDDDISIISEDEEDSGSEESLEGWVLYRLSPITSAEDGGSESDEFDSDFVILAGDEDGLESLPDLEEFSWSTVRSWLPETGNAEGLQQDSAHTGSGGSATDVTVPSLDSSMSLGPVDNDSSMMTEDLEPAPNLQEEGGGGGGDFPLAVKMMYNYGVESKADHILSAMVKETLPAQSRPSPSSNGAHCLPVTKKLPPHPNIVTMYDVFVDQTPDLPEGSTWYPSALPPRLNKEGGFGRNATMFLVMKKYSMTLSEFLSAHPVDVRTRCLLFAQLLEGVAHLGSHGIAHRDLKGNNVLVDLSDGTDSPHLAISDFGSCLADIHHGLWLPYTTAEIDRGGNSALMAPEIKCAEAGPDSVLDYSKADLWTAGTLAYEIFGDENPFYSGLNSRVYSEKDLPKLPGNTPEVVVKLVEGILKRNPSERPSAAVAATCLELFLWGPAELCPFSQQDQKVSSFLRRRKEMSHWLEGLTMETVCQRVFGGHASGLELQMKSTLLSRISPQDILGVVSFKG
ncbi:uncharacterized protein LOC143287723 isoform X2 [Babylonia areolata]|uniref:uncharacterized protein LOC143287723 isoform X2 n=1 Tax=Babylonia areolata TaxID=304850 RepID=UPI003FD12F21